MSEDRNYHGSVVKNPSGCLVTTGVRLCKKEWSLVLVHQIHGRRSSYGVENHRQKPILQTNLFLNPHHPVHSCNLSDQHPVNHGTLHIVKLNRFHLA